MSGFALSRFPFRDSPFENSLGQKQGMGRRIESEYPADYCRAHTKNSALPDFFQCQCIISGNERRSFVFRPDDFDCERTAPAGLCLNLCGSIHCQSYNCCKGYNCKDLNCLAGVVHTQTTAIDVYCLTGDITGFVA